MTTLSAALVSDILDDMGYTNQMLPAYLKPNYEDALIIGRARTLQLKQLIAGDDYKAIYEGLPFLESMNPGEVLVVGGGSDQYAFFGELMTTLAQYRKLSGAIIDGLTRDTAQTRNLRFPVFARDNYARDIKKRGIITSKDSPITIGTVTITRDSLIVGDYDGVIVIPSELEQEVFTRAEKNCQLEERIKEAIKNGIPVKTILEQNGEF